MIIALIRMVPIAAIVMALVAAMFMGNRLAASRATIRDLREEVAVAEATLARERRVQAALDYARTRREGRLRNLDKRMSSLNEYIVTLEGDQRCLSGDDTERLRALWD